MFCLTKHVTTVVYWYIINPKILYQYWFWYLSYKKNHLLIKWRFFLHSCCSFIFLIFFISSAYELQGQAELMRWPVVPKGYWAKLLHEILCNPRARVLSWYLNFMTEIVQGLWCSACDIFFSLFLFFLFFLFFPFFSLFSPFFLLPPSFPLLPPWQRRLFPSLERS